MVTSQVAVLTVLFPPGITAQPTNQLVRVGSNVTFNVTATGTAPLAYKWRKGGVNIANGGTVSGATSATLLISGVQTNDNGEYDAVVSNAYGMVTSTVATLVAGIPPGVTVQPTNRFVSLGISATFALTATGTGPLSYQWRKDGVNLADVGAVSGATSATLHITGVQTNDSGEYDAVVSNAFGMVTSVVAVLVGGISPTFISQPPGRVASLGAFASFAATATAIPPPVYRWQKGGIDVNDEGRVSGAATTTLTISDARRSDAGLYQLVASNVLGSATSSEAALTIVPVVAWGDGGAAELSLPADISNAVQIASCYGHNLALRADGIVAAWGWNSSGQINVPAAATNVVAMAAGAEHSLALRADGTVVGWGVPEVATVPAGVTNIVAIAAGFYHCLALAADGTIRVWGWDIYGSASAPENATNLVSVASRGYFNVGLRADGTVMAWGDWRYGGLNVPAGLSNVVAIDAGFSEGLALRRDGSLTGWGDTFSLPPGNPSASSNIVTVGAGQFHTLAVYTNGQVSAWGNNANGQTLVPTYATNIVAVAGGAGNSLALVRDPELPVVPSVRIPSENRFVAVGGTLTLLSITTGSLPFQFQWLLNGTPVPGQTNRWLWFASAETNQAGDYRLVVSNPYGSATSDVVVLSVLAPPTFVVTPTNQTWIGGSNGTLVAVASGTEPLSYQWYRGTTKLSDDARLSGTTSNILSISNVLASDAGNYSVVVTDPAGSSITTTAVVAVVLPPAFTSQPRGYSVPVGMPVSLSGSASGTAPLSYQWLLNGAPIANATSTSLIISNLLANQIGVYQLVASNVVGVVTSALAQITIGPVATWGSFGQTASFPIWPGAGLSNVIAVAGGTSYSLALRADGSIYVWGFNNPATNVPPDLSGVVRIATGPNFALALRGDGTVVAWGSNTSGQTNVPAGLSNVIAIAAGTSHSVAARADGSVVVWGASSSGRTNIPGGLREVIAVSAGGVQSLALRERGTVVGWGGGPQDGRVPPPPPGLSDVVAIASGSLHNLALTAQGTVVTWGDPTYPQITAMPAGLSNIIAIAASRGGGDVRLGLSLALESNGLVKAWGTGFLGIGTNVPLGLSNVVAVGLGDSHALAIVNDGRPLILNPPVGGTFYSGRDVVLKAKVVGNAPLSFQWFKNNFLLPAATSDSLVLPSAQLAEAGSYHLVVSNALGVAQSIAVPVTIVDSAPAVMSQPATRYAFFGSPLSIGAAFIGSGPLQFQWLRNGLPVASGTNELFYDRAFPEHAGAYQLIVSNAFGSATSSVAQITFSRVALWGNGPSLTNAPVDPGTLLGIAAGSFHALAIQSNGTVAVWGTTINGVTNVPAGLSNVVAISGGSYFSLALKSDGTVAAWGLGTSGQTNVPGGLNNVVAISAGGSHALALRANGTVAAWGSGTATNVPAGLSNVVAVSAGSTHSLALRNDGGVVGWGAVGNIPTNLTAVAIAAGYGQSIALRADGTVAWWATLLKNGPPPGLSNVVAIASGGGTQGAAHSVALKADGTVVVWGDNFYGQFNVPPELTSIVQLSCGGSYTAAMLNDRSPAFTVRPWDREAAVGSNVTLTAFAVGRPALQYQWRFHGTNLPGATNPSLTLTNLRPGQAGDYVMAAANGLGAATSAVANVNVLVPPPILSGPFVSANQLGLTFTALDGLVYVVEYKQQLEDVTWLELSRRTGTGAAVLITDSSPSAAGSRFYRVRIE
jgi:alpha-tubulin suppressor-like RCC1 family protein